MNRKRTMLRHILVILAVGACSAGSVLMGVALVDTLENRFLQLRGELVYLLEDALSQEISWESVNPSILRGITINGVSLSDGAGTAESVSIVLNPGELLRGEGRRAIPAVIIRNPRVALVRPELYERLQRTISFVMDQAEGNRIIAIHVEDGTLITAGEFGEARLEGLQARIQLEANRIHGTLRTILDAETEIRGDLFSVTTEVSATIDGHRSADPAGVTVELGRIRGSHFSAMDQAFRFERRGDTLNLERVRSQDALDLAARMNLDERQIQIDLRSESLVPASLVSFHGPWKEINPWINTPLTTSSRATLDTDGTVIEARGSFAGHVQHPSVPEPFSLQGEYVFTPGLVEVPSLTVRTAGEGRAHFSGTWRLDEIAPDGTVDFSRFAYAGSPAMDGRVTVSGSSTTVGISAKRISANGAQFHDLTAQFRSGPHAESLYNTIEGTVSLEPDRPGQLRGTIRFADVHDVAGRFEITELAAAEVADTVTRFGYELNLPEIAQGVRLSGTARFDRRDRETILRVPFLSMRDDNNPDRIGTLAGDYRNGRVTLTHFYLREGDRLTVSGSASALVRSDGEVSFSTELSANGLHYRFNGVYRPRGEVLISGPAGFLARISPTDGGGYTVSVSADDVAIPLGKMTASFELEGAFFDRRDWYVNVSSLDLRSVPLPAGGPGGGPQTADVALAAAINPETIQLAITKLQDRTSTLTGSLDARYFFSPTGIEVSASGRMQGTETSEVYRFATRYSQGTFALDLRLAGSPVARFSDEVDRGTVRGTLQAVGTPMEPEIRASLESDDILYDGSSISFRILAHLDDSVIRVTGTEIVYDTVQLDVPRLIIDRRDGDLDGEVRFQRLEQAFVMDITGNTGAVPALSLEELRDNMLEITIRATPERGSAAIDNPEAWYYQLVRAGGITTIDRLDGAIRARLTDEGEFSLTVAGDLPYRGEVSGLITAERLELTVSTVEVNLAEIPLPETADGFAIPGGTVTGSLRLIGAPDDPDFFGTLTVRDLEVKTPFSPDTIGPLDSTLIFEEQLVRLQETRTLAGTAPIDVSARVLINRLALEQFELALEIPSETGVNVVSDFGPVRVDGFARGGLRVSGTPASVEIVGNVNVYGTELAVSPAFEQEVEQGPNAIVNLTVRTGRAVRFIWPDAEIPIMRSSFATGQEVTIHVDSREGTFSLDGDVAIQSGDVFYFDRNFLIRDGRVVFQETQDDFDPRLTARAELREVTPEGPVRIYLIADGQRLSDFSPRFESSPPLDNAEIVAILGGSILQVGSEDSVTLPSALLSTSDIVTQFGFFRQFENAIQERLDLDLFAIRTSFIQNILLTAITPTEDQLQQQITPSLGAYLNNTSIFMGRHVGDDVFGQVVLQMRMDDPETPRDDDGIQRLGGVLIDSEISLEWQTPFFLLEWNFAPQEPEELFVRDNTFSIRWSFSY